ncbi:MAG: hypothetical protein QM786_15180 [Breznakibacter sp.]
MNKVIYTAVLVWFGIVCLNAQAVEDNLSSQIGRSARTGSEMAGYWTRMATCTNDGGWGDFGTVFEILGNGSANNQFFFGKLIARFKRQDATAGPATNVSLILMDSNIGAENIKGVGNGATIDIYVRINADYTNMHYRRIVGAGGLITLLDGQPLVGALPEGTIINCKEWSNMNNLNAGTVNTNKLVVDGSEQATGLFTDIMGRSHEIVFGATRNKSIDWIENSMIYTHDAGAYDGGAGAIRFIGNGGQMDFYISEKSTGVGRKVDWGISKMTILRNGNVGIGKSPGGSAKLDVSGTIRATEIKVEAQTADFVFDDSYVLRDLKEVESFISQHKHLPDIPSATQMEADGVNLAEMNKLLLQKIEELTLYVIEQQKKLDTLAEKVNNPNP